MANKPNSNKKQVAKLDRNELSKLAFSMLEDSQTKKKTTSKNLESTATRYLKNNKVKNTTSSSPQSVVNKYIKTTPTKETKKTLKRSDKTKNKKYEKSIYNSKVKKNIAKPPKKNEKLIVYNDEELLKYYIGNNNKKIINRHFNISAFFFSSFYYLYRKLYVLGSISLAISLIILSCINDIKIVGLIFLIFSLIMGLLFNYIYVKKAKYNIEKIKRKHINENINEFCVLTGGTDSLVTALVVILYFIIIILFYFQTIFNWYSNIVDFSNKIEKKQEETIFKDMIESYAASARQNIEQPGLYRYKMNDEEYDFIALPVAEDEGNIYCVKTSQDAKWENKEGLQLKENSISCDEFMEDIMKNYSKFYDIKLPITGEIIISNKGKIVEGSNVVFEDKTCEYQINIKDFKCD